MVLDHPGDEQVLNDDGPELPGQAGGELVESVRWSATLPCAFARAADALRQRFDGSRRFLVALSYGPTLRDTVRFRCRTLRSAPLECRGLANS